MMTEYDLKVGVNIKTINKNKIEKIEKTYEMEEHDIWSWKFIFKISSLENWHLNPEGIKIRPKERESVLQKRQWIRKSSE